MIPQHVHVSLTQLHPVFEQAVRLWFVPQPIDLVFLRDREVHALAGVLGVVTDDVHAFEQPLQLGLDGLKLPATDLHADEAQELAERGAQMQRVRLRVEARVVRFDHRARPQLEQARILAIGQIVGAGHVAHDQAAVAPLDLLDAILGPPVGQGDLRGDLRDEAVRHPRLVLRERQILGTGIIIHC